MSKDDTFLAQPKRSHFHKELVVNFQFLLHSFHPLSPHILPRNLCSVDKNQMNLIIKHKITFPFSGYCLISTFIQDLRLNLKLVPKFPFVPTWLVTRMNPSEVTKKAGIRSPAEQQLFSVAVNLSNSDQPFIWDSTQICSEITKYSPHFGNVATKLSFETFNNFTGS